MVRTLIVADDLSGAADSAVAAAAAGWRTLVSLGLSSDHKDAEVLAVDADTRRLPSAEAEAETARVVRACYQPGQIFFKKMDSTLRGNFAVELRAILQTIGQLNGPATQHAVAIVAPAFPATGRTTRNGMQLLQGVPLEATDIWRRERISGRASIPEMLCACGLRCGKVGLETIRGGNLERALQALAPDYDALVCDAETEADLHAIALSSASLSFHPVLAGSAGLARCLFGLEANQRGVQSLVGRELPAITKPILFVVGSAAALSRNQAQSLLSDPDVASIEVSADALCGQGTQVHNTSLAAALAAGRDTVLLLGGEIGAEDQLSPEQGQRLCRALAQLAVSHAPAVGAMVLTGGETARAVLESLRVQGLWLIGELEPGVPLSVSQGASLPVVTKAGAFGDEGTLQRCRAALRKIQVPRY